MEETRKDSVKTEGTSIEEALPELSLAAQLLRREVQECENDNNSFLETLAMLLSITKARLRHYDKRYNFRVADTEVFYPENTGDWMDFERRQAGGESATKGDGDGEHQLQ